MRLYLDDVRPTPDGFDVRAYTSAEAIGMLRTGKITFISFDHDLGADANGTGYDVAKWIEEQAFTNPAFVTPEFAIHSANPVGAVNIGHAMRAAQYARNRPTPSVCRTASDHLWMDDNDLVYCGRCFVHAETLP